mmetsp:Transcript_6190/g.20201  ORF Transcript_6190/g.20201 Transcript_6190/m.20201 type:complete len:243 (+) Transcript_6190:602-1330(+)
MKGMPAVQEKGVKDSRSCGRVQRAGKEANEPRGSIHLWPDACLAQVVRSTGRPGVEHAAVDPEVAHERREASAEQPVNAVAAVATCTLGGAVARRCQGLHLALQHGHEDGVRVGLPRVQEQQRRHKVHPLAVANVCPGNRNRSQHSTQGGLRGAVSVAKDCDGRQSPRHVQVNLAANCWIQRPVGEQRLVLGLQLLRRGAGTYRKDQPDTSAQRRRDAGPRRVGTGRQRTQHGNPLAPLQHG